MGKIPPYKAEIDFFRPNSGKWYSGGEIEVSHYEFDDDLLQEIVDKQSVMRNGWQGEYDVVVKAFGDNAPFLHRIFRASKFANIRKKSEV